MSAALSKVREGQIEEAHAFLQETRGKRTVRHQILPEADSFALQYRKPAELLETYGAAYRKYLQHSLITEKICNACRIASERIPELEHPNTASDMATYRLGSSGCDELSIDLWMRAFAKGKPAFRVYATSEVGNYNHVFVIYGTSNEELIAKYGELGSDLFALMKSLTKGIIIDPYLNLVCPVEQFEDSALGAYCRESNITEYDDSIAQPAVENVKEAEILAAELSDEAQRVVVVARTLINGPQNSNRRIANLKAVLQQIQLKVEVKGDDEESE